MNVLFDQSLMFKQEKGVVKKKCESGVGVIEGRVYSVGYPICFEVAIWTN